MEIPKLALKEQWETLVDYLPSPERRENLFSEVTSEDGRYCYMVLILSMASFVLQAQSYLSTDDVTQITRKVTYQFGDHKRLCSQS